MTRGPKPAPTVDADAAFAALMPGALENLSRDGHLRLRDTDLARAMTQAPPRRAARRPHGLAQLAAITASALAVGAIATVTALHRSAQDGEPRFSLVTGSAPPRTGAYWNVTLRLRDKITQMPDGPHTMPGKALEDMRYTKLPYTAFMTYTAQLLRAFPDAQGVSSIKFSDSRGKPGQLTFPSRTDKTRWRAAGSPGLTLGSFGTEEPQYGYHLDNGATPSQLAALPTDAAGLEAELRPRFEAAKKQKALRLPPNLRFTQVLWDSARSLLTSPVSPATKAAYYRVLARQPGVRFVGGVTDPLGRPGAALELPGNAALSLLYGQRIAGSRLIVDPRTAQLLAYEVRDTTKIPVHSESYTSTGWTDHERGR